MNNKNSFKNKMNSSEIYSNYVKYPNGNIINEISLIHQITVEDKTPLNMTMCKTLIKHLTGDNLNNFKTDDIEKLKKMLYECSQTKMQNSFEHNLFVVLVNKFCDQTIYNENVINFINNDMSDLLKLLAYDHKLISKLKSQDDKYYTRLLNGLNNSEIVKVFKYLNTNDKSIPVCKYAIYLDYNCIKHVFNNPDNSQSNPLYTDDVVESFCDVAIATGHKNLNDIPQIYHNQNICNKYLETDINNLKYLKHNSKLSDEFFLNLINKDIQCISMISDPFIFSPNVCNHIISIDPLLIKYIPPSRQSLRLIELASKKNKIAKYWVTYNCFPNINKTEIINLIKTHFYEIKNNMVSLGLGDIADKYYKQIDNLINFNTGILISNQDSFKSIQTGILDYTFSVMTGENYLNHQYKQYYTSGYNPNIDVFDTRIIVNDKINNINKKNMTEISTMFVDKFNNSYVILFEIFNN